MHRKQGQILPSRPTWNSKISVINRGFQNFLAQIGKPQYLFTVWVHSSNSYYTLLSGSSSRLHISCICPPKNHKLKRCFFNLWFRIQISRESRNPQFEHRPLLKFCTRIKSKNINEKSRFFIYLHRKEKTAEGRSRALGRGKQPPNLLGASAWGRSFHRHEREAKFNWNRQQKAEIDSWICKIKSGIDAPFVSPYPDGPWTDEYCCLYVRRPNPWHLSVWTYLYSKTLAHRRTDLH